MPRSSSPEPEQQQPQQKRRFQPAVLLSLVAILISLFGTVIAIFETNLLSKEQTLMADQMAASSWPYVERTYNTRWQDSTIVNWAFIFDNKGTGPAILGEVKYYVGGQEVEHANIEAAMKAYWPDQELDIEVITGFDNSVISPGDETTFLIVDWVFKEGIEEVMATIHQEIQVEFCYCSIHGACWLSADNNRPKRNPDCEEQLEL